MYSVEEIITMAATLAGRGDKLSFDDLNQGLKILNSILTDWSVTRGVELFNIQEATAALDTADTVLHNSVYYQCYNAHISSSDNEPGVGSLWEDYWVITPETTTPLTWAADNSYLPNNELGLNPSQIDDAMSLRILHEGQFSPVEKIRMLDFNQLDRTEFGLPTKAYLNKSALGTSIKFWPINNKANATLHYYSISRPAPYAPNQTPDLPEQWVVALYYALAVELGFVYNISMERLNVLGQKAQYEFNKAFRSNESEVDRCFVKPCY